jgi:hypothetical protein
LSEVRPGAQVVGFEADVATASQAWRMDTTRLFVGRTDEVDLKFEKACDLLLADFNTVTQLKRAELDDEIKRWDPERIIFTDVACGKLHLNYGAYGLRSPDLRAYWRSWNIEGYEFENYSKCHHAASTGLFYRS